MQKVAEYVVLLCFITSIILGIGGRTWLASQKPLIEHDEGITLLAATGHQGELAQVLSTQSYPMGEVVNGREWRRFIEIETPFVFGTIRSDLTNFDIHPPLYFWLLHIWSIIFGTSAYAAVMLNTVISALIAMTLFVIGRELYTTKLAYMMVALWLLSAISLHSTQFIRQYHLLTWLGLLFAYLTWRFFYNPQQVQLRWQHSILWILVAALMMLTHSVALFFLVASVVTILLKGIFQHRKRILLFVVHLITSIGLVVLVHPGYISQFIRGRGGREAVTWEAFVQRVDVVISLTLGFILDLPYHKGIYSWMRPVMIIGLATAIVLPLLFQFLRLQSPRLKHVYTSKAVQTGVFWFLFFGAVYGGATVLYVADMSPIDYRYYTQGIAFFTFIPAMILSVPILDKFRSFLIIGILAVMMVSSVLTVKQISETYARFGNPARLPQGNEFVIVNISYQGRGHLTQVIYNISHEAPTYVQVREKILDETNIWLDVIETTETTLLLGVPNNDLFAVIEDAGYIVEGFPSYMYYTSTKRIQP